MTYCEEKWIFAVIGETATFLAPEGLPFISNGEW